MANNYLEFSEVITGLTPEEAAWLQRQTDWEQLQVVVNDLYDKFPGGEIPDEEMARHDLVLLPAALVDDASARFGAELDEEDMHFWIHSGDGGDPEAVAELIHAFLRRFRPDQWWALSWAEYCDKPRVGEFGGGAVFITADRAAWFNTLDHLTAEAVKFEKTKGL